MQNLQEGGNNKMEKRSKFIGVGGFLGAGKTTVLARIARNYTEQGLRVGIVTNDQAENLVDSENLTKDGYLVQEVAGGCFCCRFDTLIEAVKKLQDKNMPDIILAEPVGSCTDLIATVIQPLRDLYNQEFEVAPYAVLVDPLRVQHTLIEESSILSEKVVYIFRKQLEEADAILLNKVDSITIEERNRLLAFLQEEFPKVSTMAISAYTGEGLEELFKFFEAEGQFGRNILEVDYDIYAEGEAMLGWLNATVDISSDYLFSVDELLLKLVKTLKTSLSRLGTEPAHLKVLCKTDGEVGIANLVSNTAIPMLSRQSSHQTKQGRLIINARVQMDPDSLHQQVKEALYALCQSHNLKTQVHSIESFKPGRPVPKYRYDKAVVREG